MLVAAAAFLWPTSEKRAGYPFAKVTGKVTSPLWTMEPGALGRMMAADEVRLLRLREQLDAALEATKQDRALLAVDKVDDVTAEDRGRLRYLWWSFFEPLLAVDAIKERYEHWYGIDYLKRPHLHARAYALSFSALCTQVAVGNELVTLVAGRKLPQRLFDEAMPEVGLPARTFSGLRDRLARSRDFTIVPVGAEWYDVWIARHVPDGSKARALVTAMRGRALGTLDLKTAKSGAVNKVELVKSIAFKAWFPIQKKAATWFGDTRVVAEDRRLIGDEQLERFAEELEPGDVIVERRNWYLSNIGLPGFWPHAALHTGNQERIRATFDEDEGVRERFGTFSEHLAKKHPRAWAELGKKDADGHAHVVVEAVSEGVVAASLEHSCGADYVAALRPRLEKVDVAVAIDRALAYFGRPYDFNFDFATDDQIVCSELVMKAYEPVDEAAPGLRVPYISVAGRRAIPPTEIVRVFANEGDADERQLDFVYFLDGREKDDRAVVADAAALRASVDRPKWDVAQP